MVACYHDGDASISASLLGIHAKHWTKKMVWLELVKWGKTIIWRRVIKVVLVANWKFDLLRPWANLVIVANFGNLVLASF